MIRESDIRIDIYRAGTVESCRITHIPTGYVEEWEGDRRSRPSLRKTAMEKISHRVAEFQAAT